MGEGGQGSVERRFARALEFILGFGPEMDEMDRDGQMYRRFSNRTAGRAETIGFPRERAGFAACRRSRNAAPGVGTCDATTFPATSYGKPANCGKKASSPGGGDFRINANRWHVRTYGGPFSPDLTPP